MFNILRNLIEKRFYATREIACEKVDVCFAMNRITDSQYSDLYILIDQYYPVQE